MSKILCSSSFALGSAHEKCDVWTRPYMLPSWNKVVCLWRSGYRSANRNSFGKTKDPVIGSNTVRGCKHVCGRAGTGTNYRTFSFSRTSSGYWIYSHFEYRNLDASSLCCPEDMKMLRVLLFIEQVCVVFRIFLELQIIHFLYFARGILCFEDRVVALARPK